MSSTDTSPAVSTPAPPASTLTTVATPAFSAASPSQAVAPASPSTVSSEIASLFANAVYGPTQPADPTSPVTPNPLAEALWAAYREPESTTSTAPAAAASQTAAPASTDLTVTNTIPVDPFDIALSPDGTRLYGTGNQSDPTSGQTTGSVEVVDTSTNTQVGDPIPAGLGAREVVVNPTMNRAYVTAITPYAVNVGGSQQTAQIESLVVIDTSSNKVIDTIPLASQDGANYTISPSFYAGLPPNLAVSPDGTRVFVSENTFSGSSQTSTTQSIQPVVYVIDTKTDTQIGNPIPLAPATTLASASNSPPLAGRLLMSPSSDRLYASTITANYNGAQPPYTETFVALDPTTGSTVGKPIVINNPAFTVPGSAALSPDGTKLYIETQPTSTSSPQMPSGTVLVYDTATGQQVGTAFNPTGYGPLTISPDGKTLYVADVSDSRTGKTGTFLGSSQPVPVGSVTAYDAATGAQVSDPVTVGVYPTSLAINSSGTKLYVANFGDNTISVINTTPANPNTGNPLQFFVSAVIDINSFVQAANVAIGQFLSSAAGAGGSFVQAANNGVSSAVASLTGSAGNLLQQEALALAGATALLGDTAQAVGQEALRLIGLPEAALIEPLAKAVGGLLAVGVNLYDVYSGLNGVINEGHPVSGLLQFSGGLLGAAGTAALFVPGGQLVGIGLIVGSVALDEASIVVGNFAPQIDSAVQNGINQLDSSINQGISNTVNTVSHTVNNFAQGAEGFVNDTSNNVNNLVQDAGSYLNDVGKNATNFFGSIHFP